MNSVMLSIRPKWCELIASEKKTIEVRRTKPNIQTPFKCYIYETQGRYDDMKERKTFRFWESRQKVIGEFVCNKIIIVDCDSIAPFDPETHEYIQAETCHDRSTFIQYTNFKKAFGWHISDLKIYNKPKELSKFIKPCTYGDMPCSVCEYYSVYSGECRNIVTRSPQSYMYVEELK